MLNKLDDYDWGEVFKYAGTATDDGYSARPEPPERAVALDEVSVEPFARDDVVRLIAQDGENDGDDWLGLMELKDGRFACIRARCDYTGWD